MPIGARVTLRGQRMYEFLDGLINMPYRGSRLPRRLHEGVRRPGQLHAGIRDHFIFGDRLRKDGQVEGAERDDRDDAGRGRRALAL